MVETWRQRNRDRWNAYSREWRKKRKEAGSQYYTLYNLKWRKENPKKYLLNIARQRARKLKLEFNLKEGDISIPEICPVLGIPLIQSIGTGLTHNSPSIDRFDNSKGYVKGNVNVISIRANSLKSNGTLEEFRSLVRWLENGSKEKKLS